MANIDTEITSDFLVTDTFLKEVVAAINSKIDKMVTKDFSQLLAFTENFRMEHTLAGDTAIDIDGDAEHVNGITGRLVVIGNGVNTVIIPSSWINKNEGVFNTENGAVNIIDIEYESGKVLFSIY